MDSLMIEQLAKGMGNIALALNRIEGNSQHEAYSKVGGITALSRDILEGSKLMASAIEKGLGEIATAIKEKDELLLIVERKSGEGSNEGKE